MANSVPKSAQSQNISSQKASVTPNQNTPSKSYEDRLKSNTKTNSDEKNPCVAICFGVAILISMFLYTFFTPKY